MFQDTVVSQGIGKVGQGFVIQIAAVQKQFLQHAVRAVQGIKKGLPSYGGDAADIIVKVEDRQVRTVGQNSRQQLCSSIIN